MQTIRGPSLFIAQFIDADPKLSSLEGLAAFAAECKFTALQIPTAAPKIFDLEQASFRGEGAVRDISLVPRL